MEVQDEDCEAESFTRIRDLKEDMWKRGFKVIEDLKRAFEDCEFFTQHSLSLRFSYTIW